MKMTDIFGREVTEDMMKEEIIENSNIGKIRNKYSLLRQEILKKNDPKFVKIPKEKLYYLKNNDDIDIRQDIGEMRYELEDLNKLIDEASNSLLIKDNWRMGETLRVLQFLIGTVANIIHEKFFKLFEGKKLTEDEYFSNLDYVDIEEICELVKEHENYYCEIFEILEKIVDEEILEQYGHYGAECNILNYFEWIFSDRGMEEQPYYLF